MSNHGNAFTTGQWAEFSGIVGGKLWSALKDRISEDEIKALISSPEGVMLRLRNSFAARPESGLVVPACPFFANEEVKSNYGYPEGYAVKPIAEQIITLSKHFPGLDASSALGLSKDLPVLPQGAERWFAVPRFEKVAKVYNDAVEQILDVIATTRPFHNYRKGALGPKHLHPSDRMVEAVRMIGERQKGDVLLIPGQFGLLHRGRSTRRTRIVYAPNEFGFGAFIGGVMLLTHPERFVQWAQLHVDLPGDEYSPVAGGQFGHAPCLYFDDGKVRFGADGVSFALGFFGAASGFFPQ